MKAQNNPGDVTGSVLWLKADAGVTHSSNAVTTWADQTSSGFDATSDTGEEPTFQSNDVNSNPSISFDGTNDVLSLGDVMDFDPGVDQWTFLAVFNVGVGVNGTIYARASGSAATRQYQYFISGNEFSQIIGGQSNFNGSLSATGNWTIGTATLNTTDLNSYINGSSDGSNNPGGAANQSVNVVIGARSNETDRLNGDIAEIIVYDSELGSSDQRDVESYLALKYGITLDISSDGYTVGATTLYAVDATFDNDIAGIGQDDSQGLDQTSSQSVNTGAIISIASATSQDDGDFLVWGHNGGTATDRTGDYNGLTNIGSARIWKVEETGDIGTVTITVAKADLPSTVDEIYVKNADAALGTGGAATALVDGGANWTVDVNFTDGDYFSFIGPAEPEMDVSGNSVELLMVTQLLHRMTTPISEIQPPQ